ncbi:DUF452 family protein [Desulfovibrio sp. UIB00]|uniref:pimeloyl-ACP methyl esterase BioG family protein n=1 Tax=Desulfovibrio sp. UIB00 TaxID=2804314 RepID=UPI001F10BE02|nr:pimeloyl-ACP methyl esterase BioG family protein [Desulfovibrio sp. UIB00]MCH5144566.1 DUF452 family protein [Desulfovibrio sp. UIB00]
MNIDFLRRAGCPTLELFFAGWGMDSRPFAWAADSPHTAHCDFAVCYDYTDMTLDAEALRPYSEVRVRAWSLGVYAASLVLPGLQCAVSRAMAINGTLTPVDDSLGIPVEIYDATLESLCAESVDRFNRRMCGAHRAVFEARRSPHSLARSVDSLLAELLHIKECAAHKGKAQFTGWNMAILSKKDRIFPIANMRKAWSAIPVLELDEPHYMPDIPFVDVELP